MFDNLRTQMMVNKCKDAAVFLERHKEIRSMRFQQSVPINECFEPLCTLPAQIKRWTPHAYQKLGAVYTDGHSPFHLRKHVVEALIIAQTLLRRQQPTYQLIVFDGYRPVHVQQFMVDYTFRSFSGGKNLSPEESTKIMEKVLLLWSPPSVEPATPPPHSTGAAVDLTILDANLKPLNMGGNIDDLETAAPSLYEKNSSMQDAHTNRCLLANVMSQAGFTRLPSEWWHFSIGDQWAEYIHSLNDPNHVPVARYGRYDAM